MKYEDRNFGEQHAHTGYVIDLDLEETKTLVLNHMLNVQVLNSLNVPYTYYMFDYA